MRPFHAIRSLLLFSAALAIALTDNSVAQPPDLSFTIEVDVINDLATSLDETLVRARIPDFDVSVQSRFEPEIYASSDSILVDLIFLPPDIPPGGIYLPAFRPIDETFSLGRLDPGEYELTVRMASSPNGDYEFSNPVLFTVVPEPSSVALLVSSIAGLVLLGRRVVTLGRASG